jgi:hypothetical protein
VSLPVRSQAACPRKIAGALPPKADIGSDIAHVCSVPEGDIQFNRPSGINDALRTEEYRARRDKPGEHLRRLQKILRTFRRSANQGGR